MLENKYTRPLFLLGTTIVSQQTIFIEQLGVICKKTAFLLWTLTILYATFFFFQDNGHKSYKHYVLSISLPIFSNGQYKIPLLRLSTLYFLIKHYFPTLQSLFTLNKKITHTILYTKSKNISFTEEISEDQDRDKDLLGQTT